MIAWLFAATLIWVVTRALPARSSGSRRATSPKWPRTVYGYFPSRLDLVRSLTEQSVREVTTVLSHVGAAQNTADAIWADFVAHLWPVIRRYRVLLVLRRGEYGDEIHELLGSVEQLLTNLVQRGQDSEVFGRHLPAQILSLVTYAAVFDIAELALSDASLDARAATITSLLILGVPEFRARELADNVTTPDPRRTISPT